FLKLATESRLSALYTVALAVGLRRGEALGLMWDAVHLDEGVIEVRRQLQRYDGGLHLDDVVKTKSSRRKVRLPAFAIAALKQHRVRQMEERLAAGTVWRDTDLVFTSTIGTPLDPDNVKRDFDRLRRLPASRAATRTYRTAW
ncbi:MAG: tyrosine-type recombinase/integrase, partial [Actinobacteria bacterium]|nr:tyrosine-type recombinase/integrase [Actinomycetota bacterium]